MHDSMDSAWSYDSDPMTSKDKLWNLKIISHIRSLQNVGFATIWQQLCHPSFRLGKSDILDDD